MNGDPETTANGAKPDRAPQTRQRSKISFPYMDLKAAIEMATAIHNHVGGGECEDDQLGAWTKQSHKSSTFRVQIYAARIFGVLEGEGGKHKLSELGRAIVDPNRAREAKAQAFLNVPLYKAIFENYRGGVLPPSAVLLRDMVGLGVAEKQKDRARLVFERSAEQAGFFEQGKDRLVLPGVPTSSEPPSPEEKRTGGNGGDQPPRDPLIEGLFKEVPARGTEWSADDQIRWLETAAHIFALVFKRRERIKIEVIRDDHSA
jgi:hypothetical protein